MAAYLIFILDEVTDEAGLQQYRKEARPSLIASGARFLCGPEVDTVLEGEAPKGLVILEFDSLDVAKAWYNSDEYKAAAKYRHAATKGKAYLLPARA